MKKPAKPCELCAVAAYQLAAATTLASAKNDVDDRILQFFLGRNDNAAFALRDLRDYLYQREREARTQHDSLRAHLPHR